jgi:DNA mismatch repair ATPase MutL
MLPLSDVIGNVDNGFILLHTRKSFYLLDQHAISEKSLYLQLLEEGKVGEEPSDEVVEIENVYGEVVETERKGLESLGWKYSVVERGKLSTWVRIVRVPSIMGKKSPPSEFVQIVHQLYLSQHETFTPSQKHTVATIACHNAYRIGDELSH